MQMEKYYNLGGISLDNPASRITFVKDLRDVWWSMSMINILNIDIVENESNIIDDEDVQPVNLSK